ncbi:MAG TPA: hypothetical protein DCQ30_13300 [Acidimicrobiaceae bacterium]|nr:hypothetical protein [Acidimicrobiaceae bacterium]
MQAVNWAGAAVVTGAGLGAGLGGRVVEGGAAGTGRDPEAVGGADVVVVGADADDPGLVWATVRTATKPRTAPMASRAVITIEPSAGRWGTGLRVAAADNQRFRPANRSDDKNRLPDRGRPRRPPWDSER